MGRPSAPPSLTGQAHKPINHATTPGRTNGCFDGVVNSSLRGQLVHEDAVIDVDVVRGDVGDSDLRRLRSLIEQRTLEVCI